MKLARGVAAGGLFKTSMRFLLTMRTAYEFVSSVSAASEWAIGVSIDARSDPAAEIRDIAI